MRGSETQTGRRSHLYALIVSIMLALCSSSKIFIINSVCKVVETKLHSHSENGVGKLKLTENEANAHCTHNTREYLSHARRILSES